MGRSKIVCPRRAIPWLGVLSDTEIAKKTGVSPGVVARWRKKRNIPTLCNSGRKKMVCPPHIIPLLGVETDSDLALQVGVSGVLVGKWRRDRGIPGHSRGRRMKEVPEDIIPLLGTVPDYKLAKRIGVSNTLVGRWRKERGIPAGRRGRIRKEARTPEGWAEWLERKHPGMLEQLGYMSDTQVGDQYGLSRERIRQFRKGLGIGSNLTREQELREEVFSPYLGKLPDRQIAEMFGVNLTAVSVVRMRLGIPAIPPNQERLEALESIKDELGTISDHQLAQRIGVSAQAVQIYRNKLGIPPAVLSPRCKGFKKIDRSVIKRMFKQGKSDAQIAEKLNTSSGTICGIRTKELGLYKVHKPLTKEQKVEIVQLVEQGYKDSVIGGMLGLGKNTVSRIRRGAGILRGHKNLKIDRAEVKRLWDEGKSDEEIAEIMGFSTGSICQIRANDLNIHKSKVKIHRDVVTRLFHEGYTDHEISEHLGCAVTSLRAVRRELRLLRSKTR